MKALPILLLNLAVFLLLIPPEVSGQTFIYNFTSPTREVNAGNNGLAVNSVWLYSKIDAMQKTDAIVKITSATGGLSVSSFDGTAAGGYDQAFQPTINVPSGTVNGYVEFQITFIKTGTYNGTTQTGTAFPQTTSIPATVLDDDGTLSGGTLYEYDELNMGTGQAPDYDASGGQLTYTTSGGFFTGRNATGTNYSGISTSATAVMFTVLNTNISSMTFRTGVISTFSTVPAARVSSLAFYMPVYPNAILASSWISAFHGVETGNSIQLNWQLNPAQGLAGLDLERTFDGSSFAVVKSYILGDNNDVLPTTFTDAGLPSGAAVGYRLKALAAAGSSAYSEIVDFQLPAGKRFSAYPNPVVNSFHVAVSGTTPGAGILQLLDYSGRVVWRRQIYLNQGSNSLLFQRPAGLPAGNYIVVIQAGDEIYTQKIALTSIGS